MKSYWRGCSVAVRLDDVFERCLWKRVVAQRATVLSLFTIFLRCFRSG